MRFFCLVLFVCLCVLSPEDFSSNLDWCSPNLMYNCHTWIFLSLSPRLGLPVLLVHGFTPSFLCSTPFSMEGYMEANMFSPCIPIYVFLLFSHLINRLAEYKNLGWKLFSLGIFKALHYYLLVSTFKTYDIVLNPVPLYTTNCCLIFGRL